MKYLVAICLTLTSSIGFAQTNPTIRTGRPGQAIGPYVVGTGLIQFQSGVDMSKAKSASTSETTLLNNVVRYGLSESFELSGVVNYQSDKVANSEQDGISGAQLGFRYNLIDKPQGWVPGFGIQTRFKLTSVSDSYKKSDIAPVILLVTQHKLSEVLSLVNNLGISYDGNTSTPTHVYITNLSFPLVDEWGGFVEVYGNEKNGLNNHFVDGGFSYLVNNDLQLDISGGWGKNHGVTDTFISLGVSWRTQLLGRMGSMD